MHNQIFNSDTHVCFKLEIMKKILTSEINKLLLEIKHLIK